MVGDVHRIAVAQDVAGPVAGDLDTQSLVAKEKVEREAGDCVRQPGREAQDAVVVVAHPADAGAPLPGAVAGPCFSCQPNQISDNTATAAPGPAPTVSPVLTHSNSGANHDDLTVGGVDFTPNESVHIELRPDHDGDFNPYVTDRGASPSGSIHVQFYGYQTVSPHDRGARGGYVVATDTTTLQSTAPLPVIIFPAVTIDHG
ncbi:MAG: hypothetical protein QOG75_1734 [Mycobacterium sp.]|nr:hypothetical protein [Mycobacterium sp.]